METELYENFPARIVFLANLVAVSIYAVGTYILGQLGIVFAAFYLLYCLSVEVMVLRGSCVNCYYYDKTCGLGKGKLCARVFQKGEPRKFIEREVSWREIAPDMMVLIFPLVGGIALLARDFAWSLVALLVILILLSFGGNAIVRGTFACKHCKQRELGCPAQQLFEGENG